jgi:hypothetical protein
MRRAPTASLAKVLYPKPHRGATIFENAAEGIGAEGIISGSRIQPRMFIGILRAGGWNSK